MVKDKIILKLCECGKVFWNKRICCKKTKLENIVFKKRGRPFGSRTAKVKRRRKKRIKLPDELIRIVYERSKFICEENNCDNTAKPIHHKIAVSKRPDLQHELWNLIHLCISCHRNRHPELPDCLFY